jgi:hypothetical protein
MARTKSRHQFSCCQLGLCAVTYSDDAVVKVAKGDQSADVDKGGAVEEQVDDVGEDGVFRGFVEETTGYCELRVPSLRVHSLPGKGTTACKSRQKVVAAQQSGDTYRT